MPDISPSPDASDASTPPQDAAELDEWLRSHLDHRLTVVLLVPPASAAGPAESILTAAMASHAEMRLRVERIPPSAPDSAPVPPDAAAIEHALLKIDALYPDVLLVERAADPAAGVDDAWPRAVFRIADRLGLCDRAFMTLVGPGVTREYARRLGFEDGYPLETPAPELARKLAREAVARDELRRHGSSPPCYL